MLSFEEVTLIKRTYPTMHCSDKDFYLEYTTLQTLKPETIYEMGVGSGEWIISMQECLDYEPWWIGVENFVSAYFEVDYYGPLPRTPSELTSQIAIPKFKHYYTHWEPIIQDQIPAVACRLDMSLRYQDLYDIITDHCDKLFIDDVYKPDYKFRLDFALNSNMQIFWEGEKEVCLTQPLAG